MSNTMQSYLAAATQKASDDLIAALQQIPEDKHGWRPSETARTALDQAAECALLNGYTAELIQTHQWSMSNMDAYVAEKTDLASGKLENLLSLLKTNTQRLTDAIIATPDETLTIEIQLASRKMPLSEVLGYPYWNMSYHQGQINYIASILGCLK